MIDNQQTATLPKRTPAQRMFYRHYLPYIKPKVLELLPQSYLMINDITEHWAQTAQWNTEFAKEIVFQSKAFFKQTISPDSGYAWNPEFLSEVIDLIIQHLMPYFINAPHYKNASAEAKKYLEQKLKTENAFYNRAVARYENSLAKKARKAAIAAEAQNMPIKKKKRERIKYEHSVDEFNNIKCAMRIDLPKVK